MWCASVSFWGTYFYSLLLWLKKYIYCGVIFPERCFFLLLFFRGAPSHHETEALAFVRRPDGEVWVGAWGRPKPLRLAPPNARIWPQWTCYSRAVPKPSILERRLKCKRRRRGKEKNLTKSLLLFQLLLIYLIRNRANKSKQKKDLLIERRERWRSTCEGERRRISLPCWKLNLDIKFFNWCDCVLKNEPFSNTLSLVKKGLSKKGESL